MPEKRVAIYTLGCKVNQYESAALGGLFQERGYRVVGFGEDAGVYFINTCTVTHHADRQVAARSSAGPRRANPQRR